MAGSLELWEVWAVCGWMWPGLRERTAEGKALRSVPTGDGKPSMVLGKISDVKFTWSYFSRKECIFILWKIMQSPLKRKKLIFPNIWMLSLSP